MANKKSSRVRLQFASDRPVLSAVEGRRATSDGFYAGSALILVVVLTSLLAVIGVMFVMAARVDRISTSAIAENKQLNLAVETVLSEISQKLALDVPRTDSNGLILSEYYDYPGSADKWLASLEPYQFAANDYRWRQISDVYEKLPDSELPAEIISDYQNPSEVGDSNSTDDYPADADGDGVADSKWIELDDITSGKGRPIYAAIRVVDNGGMLNVNTAYMFDPCEVNPERIDGSSQMQINLAELSQRSSSNGLLDTAAEKLHDMRCNDDGSSVSLSEYERDVVWRYDEPNRVYTPFDISDELELRNRFLLNNEDIKVQLEDTDAAGSDFWKKAYNWGIEVPRTDPVEFAEDSENGRNYWFFRTYNGSADPNIYDYRHISTIYNMDRIIRPNGDKMLNINTAGADSIYEVVRGALVKSDPGFIDVNEIAAQIAVNLKDFRDGRYSADYDPNDNVTVYLNPDDGITYYGFERPCVYISELAHCFKKTEAPGGFGGTETYRSYAVELYKPYVVDSYPEPNQWRLSIEDYSGSPIPINWLGTQHFHVILFEDPCAPLAVSFNLDDNDPNFSPSAKVINNPFTVVFSSGKNISLERLVDDDNDIWIPVDSISTPAPVGGWLTATDGNSFSVQRDITLHKCIRRLWGSSSPLSPTLGYWNDYELLEVNPIYIQAHPANKAFTNIGEIGMLLRRSAYCDKTYIIDEDSDEEDVRLDLADHDFQQLFKYLTVWPPAKYVSDANETRVKGRININTAPWFVLAQLPWVTDPALASDDPNRYNLARKIVEHRDDSLVEGFKNIGELMNVAEMYYYKTQSGDLTDFPDLTTLPTGGDGAPDDFEERDVIFARISNLVTVRSDVFTAYILVRIGTDGPQKRVVAILDRSGVYSAGDKVRIVAVHPVPDPR